MDTLSSSLTLPNLRRKSADLHNFKNPHVTSSSSSPLYHFTYPKISNKPHFITHTTKTQTPPLKQSQPRPQVHHKKAATGYAAALVDIAKCNNSLETLRSDVSRVSKLMRSGANGWVLKEVLSKGNFHKQLVGLLRVLVEKGKVGLVDEVLMEFERIYDELCGTQFVLVSANMRMEKNEMFGVAKRVHEVSGAGKVKVKVTKFFDDNKKRSYSFAL